MVELEFSNISYLWFLAAIPLLVALHLFSLNYLKRRATKFANFEALEKVSGRKTLHTNYGLLLVRILVLVFFVFAAADPVLWYEAQGSNYDFVVAIDASSSMTASDFQPTRMEAAKEAAVSFLDQLKNGPSIGIVSFAGSAFVKLPPTNDMSKAKDTVYLLSIEKSGGTAIGDAIITSSNLFLKSNRSKAIVLLTDGQNNAGTTVEEAASYAKSNGIKVHTIAVGTENGGMSPELPQSVVFKVDETALKKISSETDGKFFSASEPAGLNEAFSQIANETVTKIPFQLSLPLLALAFLLVLLEWVLVSTGYYIL